VGRGTFDVIIFVLSCPAFCGKHCATVDVFEIAIGKFIPSFGLFVFLVVDA
jgi:hypothetical protein